jgi:D-sedoheptulose 7-phosphate isomerase
MFLEDLHHIDLLIDRYPQLAACRPSVIDTVDAIVRSHRLGGKVLLCGNGGSAADAEHIVGELAKGFALHREMPIEDSKRILGLPESLLCLLEGRLQPGVRAFALGGSSPLATAIANDGDPQLVYAQMVYVYGIPGDVLIGISTSGNSKNIVAALAVGRTFGLTTIGLVGSGDCALDAWSDIIIKAPASETFKIQELHLPIYHAICLSVESELFRC